LTQQADTASQAVACTSACTRKAKPEKADLLAPLAAALLGLSQANRARLAAMLLEQHPEGKAGENAP
jgi:hypothetical protein